MERREAVICLGEIIRHFGDENCLRVFGCTVFFTDAATGGVVGRYDPSASCHAII